MLLAIVWRSTYAVPLGTRGMTTILSYIDPGSGSLFLQALAGGVAAVGVLGKVYWRRLKRFLHIGKPEDESTTRIGKPEDESTPS
jgi:hypothetical protein